MEGSPELQTPEPEEELTLLRGIDDYLRADEKRNNTERKVFAIDRLVEFFQKQFPLGEHFPLSRSKSRMLRNTKGQARKEGAGGYHQYRGGSPKRDFQAPD